MPRQIVVVLEWLVLLPLWRNVFRPKFLQVTFACLTVLLWVLIVAAIASSGGEPGIESSQSDPTAVTEITPDGPEPSENSVEGAPGAVAEAENVRVTLHELTDPWVSESPLVRPPEGRRFVAFDVTIENSGDSGTHTAAPIKFRLSDTEDFAYERTLGWAEPSLDRTDLGSGQKTRGWVTFEVDEGAALALLKYDPAVLTTKDIEFRFE